jgi:hypothetical protein
LIDLKSPSEGTDNVRLPTLLKILTSKYGEEWVDLEPETISLDMELALSPLLLDKINVLRILVLEPEMFYQDLLFFLHATDVFNNIPADFETFPLPNSLQIAWAAVEIHNVVDGEFDDEVRIGVTKLLNEEGYSEAPIALQEVCFPDRLVQGQEIEDRTAKAEAVAKYIEHMESWT